jgi:hypothetical protein
LKRNATFVASAHANARASPTITPDHFPGRGHGPVPRGPGFEERRASYLGVGLKIFCPLRPLPCNVAFAVSRISLFVITPALCLPTLSLRVVPCPLSLLLYTFALVLPLPFVLEIAVGTTPFANVVAGFPQLVP